MALDNPAFSRNPALSGSSNTNRTLSADELNRIYSQPAATLNRPGIDQPAVQPTAPQNPFAGSSDPMTYDDTIAKTAGLFAILIAFAVVGWMVPVIAFPAAIAGFVVGLIASFKKVPSVPLYVAYAALEGLFVGGISNFFEGQWSGIVVQAVLGTLSVFAVMLLLFRSGKVRTSAKATKVVLIAMGGYALFSLLNFGMMMFNVPGFQTMFGARDQVIPGTGIPFGIVLGLLAVCLAAYCLVMDFEYIKNGVEARAPRVYGWTGAFGLLVTLVWLYLEILRIIAILRGND
ncbi:Bax inhibitor-1/YccA family protein [Klugiella xanthotipulae]|uniref:Putative YccA/Bax inhibitor family protein n=1 Tax=Klugiella xanthotipulae TaxID=244735 RepID=A0A543I552_9MICO|nr:Bax inhibitor-1/YccA family protein [Klugiella xanthotipulae]TQM65707.1 putative YccA/Bax inhibitor family protein [Klugiella xanthotipulae]